MRVRIVCYVRESAYRDRVKPVGNSDLASLRQRFGALEYVGFDKINDLVRVNVGTRAASATIFLQGAHLSAWQPLGEDPVIFLSRKTELRLGQPLRGGIPIVFPWFATDRKQDRIDGHPGPSHGFARIQEWELLSVAREGDEVTLVCGLEPTEFSRRMGFNQFSLRIEFIIGSSLHANLTVSNTGTEKLAFEEAFHTYFHVIDIHETSVEGLEPTGFIDKVENFARKPAEHAPIRFTKRTDRVYENTSDPCTIHDGAQKREIRIVKSGSHSTVVWNPFGEMPDVGQWDWHEFVAVETANVASNAVILAPGAHSTMGITVEVERMKNA